jgi:hypothetical protein
MNYCLKGHFPKKEKELFWIIKFSVERLQVPDFGENQEGEEISFSSHMLTRAVAELFPVSVWDGVFAGAYEHSWLETENKCLIDVLPVSSLGGPIMFSNGAESPKRRLYRADFLPSFEHFSSSSFRSAVNRIRNELESNLNKAGIKSIKGGSGVEFL